MLDHLVKLEHLWCFFKIECFGLSDRFVNKKKSQCLNDVR